MSNRLRFNHPLRYIWLLYVVFIQLVNCDSHAHQLRSELIDLATHVHTIAQREGSTHSPIVTIIDYTLPSTEKRLWTINISDKHILFHSLVSHGQGSGKLYPVRFSNRARSHMSSIGVFRTSRVYMGKHGLSLRLMGLEHGFNDSAERRHIVVHGAAYASYHFAQTHAYLGRSFGCFALEPTQITSFISLIKNNTLLIAYYPDKTWLSQSHYVA